MSIEISKEIDQILKNPLSERHTYFQLQYFLIGKEPTIQSKLWRCVRELKTRKESMDAIKFEIDDANDDVELINIDIEHLSSFPNYENILRDDLTKKTKEIKKRKLERKKNEILRRIESLHSRYDSLLEESAFIVKAFCSLEKQEKIRPNDDINSQKEYWNEKLGQDFNLRLLLGLPFDLELIKTILALNSDSAVKTDALNMIDAIHRKVENKKEFEQLIDSTKCKQDNKIINIIKEQDGI